MEKGAGNAAHLTMSLENALRSHLRSQKIWQFFLFIIGSGFQGQHWPGKKMSPKQKVGICNSILRGAPLPSIITDSE